jgi:hypothetical protein
MTAADLLADLTRQGFSLSAEGGGIRVTPASHLTAEQRKAIQAHKPALLALLPRTAPAFSWDQAEAERLLDHLRCELARLEHTWPGAKFPPAKANAVQIAVEVCESYVQDHDREAAAGWDAAALLRSAVAGTLSLATPPTAKRTK